ncbi:MAG: hypothetical protein SFU56_12740, partial [Capsulimonadales bacterium]|nr:hypothetical protein [Capsulimonadales bacterium]
RESDVEAHITALRKRAERVKYICHHPYHRLVRGFDEAFMRTIPDAALVLDAYRSKGLLFDANQMEEKMAQGFAEYRHLEPDASWRLSEEEFWKLAEMRCPIDLRRYRDSNYDSAAIEPNLRCERKRGRKIEQRRYTPFQKIVFCASHGFSSQTKDGREFVGPNPRYRMIRGASQREFDGIRCPGESQRDRTQEDCITIGADGRVYKVLNHHVQEVLAGLRQDGTLAEMIGARLSDAERSALLQRKAALEANQDETLERYDLTEREFTDTLKNIKSPPLIARARQRHNEAVKTFDRQIAEITVEIERVNTMLTDTVDESLVEDALRAAENWQQFFDEPAKVERGNAILQQVVDYFTVAAENNSKVQEVIVSCRWVNKQFYLVTWRGKSHERFTFSDTQNAWLIKNYNRPTLRLATIEKHFPGMPFLVIERHARDVLGLRRTNYRGKAARNLKAEWFAKHGSWARQNKDVLYGVLDAHPLKARRMMMYGKNGEPLGTHPIPREVKANLKTLVENRCPGLP